MSSAGRRSLQPLPASSRVAVVVSTCIPQSGCRSWLVGKVVVGRRRLPSHTSTSSRHHDTTCATLHAAGSQASPRVLRRRPQLPVIVADSTSFFLSRSRQTPKSRRRLPSHTSTPSRHRDTTCATLALLPTELARPLRHLPLLAPPPLFRRPDYDGVLRRLATCAREAGCWLLRHVLLRSVYLPFFPQNRSIVTAVLSTRHLARYSPKGLRQATGKHASGHGCVSLRQPIAESTAK